MGPSSIRSRWLFDDALGCNFQSSPWLSPCYSSNACLSPQKPPDIVCTYNFVKSFLCDYHSHLGLGLRIYATQNRYSGDQHSQDSGHASVLLRYSCECSPLFWRLASKFNYIANLILTLHFTPKIRGFYPRNHLSQALTYETSSNRNLSQSRLRMIVHSSQDCIRFA